MHSTTYKATRLRKKNELKSLTQLYRKWNSAVMDYRKIANSLLTNELDVTIAEIRTGNYKKALLQFESRIGSSLLSNITRRLIGTLQGDDQTIILRCLHLICINLN